MDARTALIGDRAAARRHLALGGTLFAAGAAVGWLWWSVVSVHAGTVASVLSVGAFVVVESYLTLGYGVLGTAVAGAYLVTRRRGGALLCAAVGTLAVGGYVAGRVLAGIPHGRIAATTVEYGVVSGAVGFLLGAWRRQRTDGQSESGGVKSRRRTALVLSAGFLSGAVLCTLAASGLRALSG